MKRGREERFMGPQVKRPALSRGISPGAEQVSGGSERLTAHDALAYLKEVKDMFEDKKEKYDEFLEVMKDFKSERIDTDGVIARVKDLFKGHRHLVLGFNAFLPKDYEITLPLEEDPLPKKQPVEFGQAISYVNRIKARFQNDEPVYKAFLEILNMYRRGNKSIGDVYQEVSSLFRGHWDLLEQFKLFLPDSTDSAHVNHIPPAVRPPSGPIVGRDERSSGFTSMKHLHKENSCKREKKVSSQNDPHQRFERPLDEGVKKTSLKHEKDQKEDQEQKESDRGDKCLEQHRDRDMDVMHGLPQKQKFSKSADELIHKKTQEGEVGGGFGGQSVQNSSIERDILKNAYSREFYFLEKVKLKLCSNDAYQDFLKCMHLYSSLIIDRSELQILVAHIFRRYPDLMDGFNEFLSRFGSNDGILADAISEQFDTGKGELTKPARMVKDREHDRGMEKEIEREKEQDCERKMGRESTKVSVLSNKDKYSNKPISELDLSNCVSELDLSKCERCTPSYRLLPNNYMKSVSSYRTDLAKEVLNDNWVSVTSGSEDYSFKHMRKNQYEESLFRCEDDRFELDMLLESNAVTTKRVKELFEKMQDCTIKQDAQIQIDDHLTAINKRCIERIYGDHGLDVIDLLRKDPAVALPVILTRLKQKQEEWSRCRADMNKVWAEVYAKNYQKSLDHRSFYFKQQDRKGLSTKALLLEIKEINEKKRKEDGVLLAIAAGNRRLLIPHLKYEYPDPAINEDLSQIIRYSSNEVCTTVEQYDKVMRIWTIFSELMFGVLPQPQVVEDLEDVLRSKSSDTKNIRAFTGESDGTAGANFGNSTNTTQLTSGGKSKDNTETETTIFDRLKMGNGEAPNHGDSVDESNQNQRRDDGLFRNLRIKKLQPLISTAYEVDGTSSCAERFENTNAVYAVGADSTSGRLGLGHVTEIVTNTSRFGHTTVDCMPASKERGSLLEEAQESDQKSLLFKKESCAPDLEPETFNFSSSKSEVAHSRLTVEREEGELSPTPEIEERENIHYGSACDVVSSKFTVPNGRDNIASRKYGIGWGENKEAECGVVEGEHDADADDGGQESLHKSIEDSENASDVGEDILGSDSGNADECSHKDHEEEDDDHKDNEGKAESEGEGEGTDDAHDVEEGDSFEPVDHFLHMPKPLAEYLQSITSSESNSVVFYGNDTFYVLFRLHQVYAGPKYFMYYSLNRDKWFLTGDTILQTLYQRMLCAKKNAYSPVQKWRSVKDSTPPDLYIRFKHLLYSLLDGSADNAKFEDDCRAIIGAQSYMLFTLDKLIFKLVKQLQIIALDDIANKLLQLHLYERSRLPARFIDPVYHANACTLLHGENVYRFEFSSNPTQLSIQLMEGGLEKIEVVEPSFSNYLNNDFLSTIIDPKERHQVFLPRNKRKYASDDEYNTMSNVLQQFQLVNGLEYKMSCNTSKASYVLDTEDFLFRRKTKRRRAFADHSGSYDSHHDNRLPQFHRWVDSLLSTVGD
eukprot:Gb_11760 [translate_table: standard]